MDAYMRNHEGYPDPTAGAAIRSAMNVGFMPVVYICSPYSGDIAGNTKKARRYCRYAVDEGFIPVAPHLMFPNFMSESERNLIMHMDLVLLTKCKELWICGDEITVGMMFEIDLACGRDLTIRLIMVDFICLR